MSITFITLGILGEDVLNELEGVIYELTCDILKYIH